MAFIVFNAHEKSAESSRQTKLQQSTGPGLSSCPKVTGRGNKGSQPQCSIKCGLNGHLAWYCTTPAPRLWPICQQPGHWKSQWPHAGLSSVPNYGGPAFQHRQAFKRLCLAEDWQYPDLVYPITLSEPRVKLQMVGNSITFILTWALRFPHQYQLKG